MREREKERGREGGRERRRLRGKESERAGRTEEGMWRKRGWWVVGVKVYPEKGYADEIT